jgi:predicted dehydrogenase
VFRDELVEFQLDGTEGSAVAGLLRCRFQHRGATPAATWDPDAPPGHDFRSLWQEVPENGAAGNAFKLQWERFLSHVAVGTPLPWDLLAGARGVQLAELALQSAREGRKVDVPALDLAVEEPVARAASS